MEWFEPILIIIAVGLVAMPFVLKYINKKKGNTKCNSRCCCCPMRDKCCKAASNNNK